MNNAEVKWLRYDIQISEPQSNEVKMIILYGVWVSKDFFVGFPPKYAMKEVQIADKKSKALIES